MKPIFLILCLFLTLQSITAQYYDKGTGKTIDHYSGPVVAPAATYKEKPLKKAPPAQANSSTQAQAVSGGGMPEDVENSSRRFYKNKYPAGLHQFNEGYGLIDGNGALVSAIYKVAHDNYDGYYRVTDDLYPGPDYGIIDSFGTLIIPVSYYEISKVINQNFFIVGSRIRDVGTIYGVVNKHNKVIIPIQYERLEEGIGNLFIARKEHRGFGVIDLKGHEIIPLQYVSITVADHKYFITSVLNKCGLRDTTGAELIKSKYKSMSVWGPDQFHVADENYTGIVDKNDKAIVPLKYKGLSGFSFDIEARGLYRAFNGDLYCLLDSSYKQLTDFKYTNILEGLRNEAGVMLFAITEVHGNFGIIDRNGQEVLPPKYSEIKKKLSYRYKSRQYYLLENINKKGKTIFGAMGLDGLILIEPKYSDIEDLELYLLHHRYF
jgi:hypothetical protein